MVILNSEESGNNIGCCTNPLPKVLRPRILPLLLSCTAPLTISLAEYDAKDKGVDYEDEEEDDSEEEQKIKLPARKYILVPIGEFQERFEYQ